MIGITVPDGGEDVSVIHLFHQQPGNCIGDNEGLITAEAVSDDPVTISAMYDGCVFAELKLTVTPIVLTYSLTGGEVGSGSISYTFTEGHKALSEVMTFTQKDNPDKTVTLVEGTDIDYTYTVSDTEGRRR